MSNQHPYHDESIHTCRRPAAFEDEREALIERIETLEARNAELHAFVEAATHDLKAQMQIIMGYAIMLNQMTGGAQDEEVRAGLGYIEHHTYQANEIVESLLLLADVVGAEGGTWKLVDMRSAAEAAVEDLAESIQGRGAVVVVDPDLPPIQGNPMWLVGVFRSLIGAALRTVDPDAPRITVEAGMAYRAIRFRVRGGRAGIEAADGKDLYETYTQAGPGSGIGMGLSLAATRRIADRLGGVVGAEREPDGRIAFWLELPVGSPA